jgi:hypothetical protein
MNDRRPAKAARFKSRLMGPTLVAIAVFVAVVGSWGVAAVCLVVGLLLTAHGWGGSRGAER